VADLLDEPSTAEASFNWHLYDHYMSSRIYNEADIVEEYQWEQRRLMPLLFPDPEHVLVQKGGILPVADWADFSKDFVEGLVAVERDGITCWPIWVVEDPQAKPRRRLFINAEEKIIGALEVPKDYDNAWYVKERYPQLYDGVSTPAESAFVAKMEAIYDGKRLIMAYELIDESDLFLLVSQRSMESASLLDGEGVGGMMMMSGGVDDLRFVDIAPYGTEGAMSVTIAYPETFTDRISIIACEDLVAQDWSLLTTVEPDPEENTVMYVDQNTGSYSSRFYHAFNADYDGDGDGISDGQEQFLDGTDPDDPDDPPNVKGTVTYSSFSGGQSGSIWVVAVTSAGSWSTEYSDVLDEPGPYHIVNLPSDNYYIKAFRDADNDGSPDLDEAPYEAYGSFTGSPVAVSGQVTGVDLALEDPDTDSDGMGDWWEDLYFGDLGESASDDNDGDKANNLLEYHTGTNPNDPQVDDSDADGMSDDWELGYGLDPNDAGDADEDPDGDGFSNLEEYQETPNTTDPTDPSDHPSGALYVSITGSDTTGTGTYANPYETISKGITQATAGQRVVVLPGTYTGASNRDLDFGGKAILVTGGADADDAVIDCQALGRGFIFQSGETANSILRRLTITYGHAERGGGILCDNADPLIVECVIDDNEADNDGGGICALEGAQPTIQDCNIKNNSSGDKGGGIYLRDGGSITGCNVHDNESVDNGGGIYLDAPGTVSDSEIKDNTAGNKGGGLYLSAGGTLTGCDITDNTAEGRGDSPTGGDGGGGIYFENGGSAANCRIAGNWGYFGGGVYFETGNASVVNCMITDNDADNRAGGIYVEVNGSTSGCTIVGNRAHEYGGGVYCYGDAVFNNTIIYHNTAVVNPNWYNVNSGTQTYRNCCTTPSVGTAPVTADPLLAGRRNPHLCEDSPCRDAGNNTYASGTDIDGEARTYSTAVDIGCDEYIGTSITGELDVDIDIVNGSANVLADVPITLQADIEGKALWFEWRIETSSGLVTLANEVEITRQWSSVGEYDVTLWAINADGTVEETLTIDVESASTTYASPSGGNVWPYTSWANAATKIEDAIDAAYAGGTVIVADGTYTEDNIVVAKPLTVQSVNGAGVTTVQGNGSDRIFRMDGPDIVLEGFTITSGGGNRRAGGVYVRHGGTVRDCVITANDAINDGGGVFIYDGGTVMNCTIANNTSGSDAGGVRIDYGGLLVDCIINNNTTVNRGGGVHLHRYGTVRDCEIKWNAQTNPTAGVGGGLAYRNAWSDALVENCTIESNQGFVGGGAHIECEGVSDDGVNHGRAVLRNCWIVGNTAVNRAGGVNADDDGDVKNSLIIDNITQMTVNNDEPDGGGARVNGGARLMNCTISDNSAGPEGRGDGVRCQSDGYVRNCIIYFNGTENTSIQPDGTGNIEYTCASNLSGGTGNITGDPDFVNRAADNYRITGAPCENAGSDSYVDAGDVDLDGNTRQVGSVDMGAYEVQ